MLPRQTPFRLLMSALFAVPLVLLACAPQPPPPAKPVVEPTKPAAAAPAAPTAAPAAAAAKPAAQPTAAPATAKAPADKRTLVVAASGDITKLDPHMSTLTPDIAVTFNIFDTLTTRDADLKLLPQLATEWKAVGDTTWEFKLRPGVMFHNGDPLTSKDIKFSIDRTYNPEAKTLVSTVFTTVDRIETPDDLTVRFVTKKPDPLLPARLAVFGAQIIPEKYFNSVGPDTFNQKPIGSGVVKFKEWVKDDRVVLEANKEYWGGAPDFDSVIIKPIPEPAPRVASLLAGEVDLIWRAPSDQVERINSSGKAHVESALFAGLDVVTLNSKVPPLDNPKVKQALSYAIDRDTILKTIWRGQGIVPNAPIAKGDTVGYDPNRPPLAYDLDKARALLQEGGYKNEPIFFEATEGYTPNDRPTIEAIVAMWKKAGVNVQMEQMELSVRAQKNRDKSFKGAWWGEPSSILQDPDGMMWRLLSPGGQQDYWTEPEWERLGNESRFSMDQQLRDRHYKRMTEIMLEHFPWIPVIQPIESYGVQNYISWRPFPNQLFQLRKENFKFNR